jgi:transcriptional regulator with XRE-family HTH domain
MLCNDNQIKGKESGVRIEEIVGTRLREAREARELTQEEFGNELAKYLGKPWPRQAVSAAEKGQRSFAAAELLAFSMALGIEVGGLFRPPVEEHEITFPSGITIGYERASHPDELVDVQQVRATLANFVKTAGEMGRIANQSIAFARWLDNDLSRVSARTQTAPSEGSADGAR